MAGSNDQVCATLWKNGEPQNLIGNENGAAMSVFVLGDDVYVAGYINVAEHIGGNLQGQVATLWKNGEPQNLTDRTNFGAAMSVFVSGSDVYVAGMHDSRAILWKNGNPQ